MEPRNAIVTGASHGIGQYIARALAARHMNLLLVARSEAELARLAGNWRPTAARPRSLRPTSATRAPPARSPRRPPPS